jgi:PBSX family phage terminase large subunit
MTSSLPSALADSLSPAQGRSIVQATARINCWDGSIRSGKTVASLLAWLLYVASAPPGELMMIGKTIQSVHRNLFLVLQNPEIFGPLADHVRYTANAPTAWILGRRVHIMGANDSKAETKLRGITLAGAYLDEATLVSKDFFDQLLGRMSVPGARLFATTNPDNPAHWLMTDYLKNPNAPLKRFRFTLDDNPFLDSEFVDDVKAMYTGMYYRRFVLGEWVAADGAIYSSWDPYEHIVDELPYIRSWVACGIDYGTTNPTHAVLLGLGDDKRLYAASEFRYDSKIHRKQLTDFEYSERLRAWLDDVPGYGRIKPRYMCVDPSAASFKIQLHRDGLNPVDGDNHVLDGIRMVASLFARRRLLVHRSCSELIQEIPGYAWDPKHSLMGVDKPIKVADHGCDALRYGVFTTRSAWAHYLPKDMLLAA